MLKLNEDDYLLSQAASMHKELGIQGLRKEQRDLSFGNYAISDSLWYCVLLNHNSHQECYPYSIENKMNN